MRNLGTTPTIMLLPNDTDEGLHQFDVAHWYPDLGQSWRSMVTKLFPTLYALRSILVNELQ